MTVNEIIATIIDTWLDVRESPEAAAELQSYIKSVVLDNIPKTSDGEVDWEMVGLNLASKYTSFLKKGKFSSSEVLSLLDNVSYGMVNSLVLLAKESGIVSDDQVTHLDAESLRDTVVHNLLLKVKTGIAGRVLLGSLLQADVSEAIGKIIKTVVGGPIQKGGLM